MAPVIKYSKLNTIEEYLLIPHNPILDYLIILEICWIYIEFQNIH